MSKVFIRTLTYHYVGKVSDDTKKEIVLDQVSWIADSGRFGECIGNGTISESEFIGDNIRIMKGNIVDVIPWKHDLPTKSK